MIGAHHRHRSYRPGEHQKPLKASTTVWFDKEEQRIRARCEQPWDGGFPDTHVALGGCSAFRTWVRRSSLATGSYRGLARHRHGRIGAISGRLPHRRRKATMSDVNRSRLPIRRPVLWGAGSKNVGWIAVRLEPDRGSGAAKGHSQRAALSSAPAPQLITTNQPSKGGC